ncbi:MAG TPA: OmpA family protein [Polyangiaceae bacterium]|nr:OmpA family protein [Polyangiaceae bacterium]
MVFRPRMGQETRFYGNMGLGFALNPLRKDAVTLDPAVKRDMEDPVQGQILLYPSVGIEILGRVGFNLMMPFVPGQWTGADPVSAGVGTGGMTGTHGAVGDARIDSRVVIWESSDKKTSIGGVAGFTIPTGTETAFGGDRGATALLFGSVEHDFGDFFLTGHIGPHFKPNGSIGGPEGSLYIGNELRWALGGFLPLRDDKVRLGVELWGSTGMESVSGQNTFFNGQNTTLEWMAQGRFLLDQKKRVFANLGGGTRLSAGYGSADVRLMASIGMYLNMKDVDAPAPPPKVIVSRPEHYDEDSDGDGYPDAIDHCPNDKEDGLAPKESDGCPKAPDADNDGIPDSLDKCPNEAEDFDGLADKDGCPEEDNDNDKVPDVKDACPEEVGPANADASLNGCPTLTKVTDDGHVQILKSVEFESGNAKIRATSFPILDEIVLLMKAQPELTIEVQGHTDSKGIHDKNVKLSQDRAASVVKYISDQGVSASRLTSQGFGPDKPIDTNGTNEGRSKNRRVEFVVTSGQQQ